MSNWDLIESIIDSVLLLPAHHRKKYVQDHYADNPRLMNEVLDLLEAIEHSDEFFEDAAAAKDGIFSQFAGKNGDAYTDNSLVGTTIDKYLIVKLISHGGMGTVYQAERNDGVYKQTVALKLIRHGMDTPNNISRFEQERFILAGLNHPNIAGLIDGGVTRFGLPYLVMEFIDGMPIHTYCDQHTLSIRERLTLFKSICETVQYAHNNMVIHRDLKPDNIFVDQHGEVKILDFGIAKLLEDGLKSRSGNDKITQQVLSPCSAAPEQVQGEHVTTATDTYALGLLLYSLLAGIPPFEFDGLSLVKQQKLIINKVPNSPSSAFFNQPLNTRQGIAEKRSSSPSKVFQLLKCDLDAIVLKALRKEIHERYQTADAFCDDLDRYLKNLPVKAHKGNFSYKAKKLLRRNYKPISVAAAMFVIISSLSLYHTIKIADEKNQAQMEAQKAAQVTGLLFNLFEASEETESLADTITAQELLYRGIQRAKLLEEQPEIQGQMYHVIGQIFYRLGNYGDALPLLNQSIDLFTDHYGYNHPETASAIASLGALLSENGEYQYAEKTLRSALAIYDQNEITDYISLASIKSNLAYTMRRQGDFESAESLFREGFNILNENLGPDHLETIDFKNSLGTTLFNIGKYSEAEKMYREVLPLRIEQLGSMHPAVGETKNSLGALMMIRGRLDESLNLLTDAYQIREEKLGDSHPRTLLTRNNIALLNKDLGNFELSEVIFQDVLSKKIIAMGENHTSTAITWFAYSELLVMMNQPEKAREILEKAIPVFEESFSENHSFTIRAKMNLGYIHLLTGDLETSIPLIEDGYNRLLDIHHNETLERAIADHQLGKLRFHQENYTEADSLLANSKNILEKILSEPTSRQQMVVNDLELLKNAQFADSR